jgi:superoxide dismutase, Cu-Zn family
VPRFRTTAIAALAATALLATSGAAYARDLHLKKVEREASAAPRMSWAHFGGKLTDLSPSTSDVYDGARATAMLIGIDNTTFVKVQIKGLEHKGEFGAHLHTGPCGLDSAGAATVGGHYNVSPKDAGGLFTVINNQTEVWLNFDVNSGGDATATATVPFVPTAGERSITFHATATVTELKDGGPAVGTAGAKLACLPLDIKSLKSSS